MGGCPLFFASSAGPLTCAAPSRWDDANWPETRPRQWNNSGAHHAHGGSNCFLRWFSHNQRAYCTPAYFVTRDALWAQKWVLAAVCIVCLSEYSYQAQKVCGVLYWGVCLARVSHVSTGPHTVETVSAPRRRCNVLFQIACVPGVFIKLFDLDGICFPSLLDYVRRRCCFEISYGYSTRWCGARYCYSSGMAGKWKHNTTRRVRQIIESAMKSNLLLTARRRKVLRRLKRLTAANKFELLFFL